MQLPHDLGDGYSLVLRDVSTAEPMHELTMAELPRLRPWEPWAAAEQTPEASRAYAVSRGEQYEQGNGVPTVITYEGAPVGSASLHIDRYFGVGELGFWIAEAHEGRGVVSRACKALIDHAREEGLARVELRTAVHNVRSQGVAHRLGFAREGTLRSALPLEGRRVDLAVFGLVLSDNEDASAR